MRYRCAMAGPLLQRLSWNISAMRRGTLDFSARAGKGEAMKRETVRLVWVILRYDGVRLSIQRSGEDYAVMEQELLELSESIEATYWMVQMWMAV